MLDANTPAGRIAKAIEGKTATDAEHMVEVRTTDLIALAASVPEAKQTAFSRAVAKNPVPQPAQSQTCFPQAGALAALLEASGVSQ